MANPIRPTEPPPTGSLPSSSPPKGWEVQESRARVNRTGGDAAGNAGVHSAVHVACLCWGSTCDAPRDALTSRPGPASAVKPRLRLPPPSLQTRGQRGGAAAPLSSRTREVPPPQGNLEFIGASGRAKGGSTNEASPRREEPGPRRRRGRTGSPPRCDVRSLSRRAALATAFPSRRVSGGRPLPFSFFLNGVLGGGRKRRADPAPLRFRQPLLSEPRFPSPSLPNALGLHFGVCSG